MESIAQVRKPWTISSVIFRKSATQKLFPVRIYKKKKKKTGGDFFLMTSYSHYTIDGLQYARVSYVISEMLALPNAKYGDRTGAEKGTTMHANIEAYLKGATEADFELKSQFEDFLATELPASHWRIHSIEKLVYSEKYRIAGTIDAIFEYLPTNELYIIDWKRTAGLYTDSARQYCLQLNIYAAILAQNNIMVSGLMLAMFHDTNATYKTSIVPAKDVQLYLEAALSL